jgi:hypothetical protein
LAFAFLMHFLRLRALWELRLALLDRSREVEARHGHAVKFGRPLDRPAGGVVVKKLYDGTELRR